MQQYDEKSGVDTVSKIRALKERLSSDLIILGHHYQREEIIKLSDLVGDSYFLAKSASEKKDAKYIVLCGVRFMAESVSILAEKNQKVLHPDSTAGCPLADMADLESVSVAWNEISSVANEFEVVPVTYINSSVELKAFCGRKGGVVCTSSNASRAFDWGFKKGKKLFFFPDQHLGRNTAVKKGIGDDEILLYDPSKPGGGLSSEEIKRGRVILWNGYCHVHTYFTVEDISLARRKYPEAKVIVHPECRREVVEASDESGSTSDIVNYVRKSSPGSIIIIGTELNLVSRIAKENPDKKVLELKRSLCPNMFKINGAKLLETVEKRDSLESVKVPEEIREDALKALRRMLEV